MKNFAVLLVLPRKKSIDCKKDQNYDQTTYNRTLPLATLWKIVLSTPQPSKGGYFKKSGNYTFFTNNGSRVTKELISRKKISVSVSILVMTTAFIRNWVWFNPPNSLEQSGSENVYGGQNQNLSNVFTKDLTKYFLMRVHCNVWHLVVQIFY